MQAIQEQWSSGCFYCSYTYDIIHFILCSIRGRVSCKQFRTNGNGIGQTSVVVRYPMYLFTACHYT